MKLVRYAAAAVENIKTHKLRSFLTMLGIIIGVASIIMTLGLGYGLRTELNKEIAKLGTNWLVLTPKTKFATDPITLTMDDVEALQDRTIHPEIAAVAPATTASLPVAYGNIALQGQIWATTAEYSPVRNVKLESGRFITKEDEIGQLRVVVLSKIVATDLFKTSDPLGQVIRIQNEPFEVIGVQAKNTGEGDPADKTVYVPLGVARKYLISVPQYKGAYIVAAVFLQVTGEEQIKPTRYQIEKTLRLRHNLAAEKDNDFSILTQDDVRKQAAVITATITAFLGGIGAISLVVGGIGIMNIMLAAVTERTREIGLRKALGAQNSDILLQFLIEALVLCVVGSIIGILLSYSASFLLNQIKDKQGEAQVHIVIDVGTMLLGIGVGLFCGLVFGLYPAKRATNLSPIEALRYE